MGANIWPANQYTFENANLSNALISLLKTLALALWENFSRLLDRGLYICFSKVSF